MHESRKPIKLSQSQIDVMKVLWQHDKLAVSDVHQALNQHKQLALTTVATVLKRLQEKDIVGYEKAGRQYLYFARVSEAEVRSSMLANLLNHLFNGEPEALVHHLVDQESVSEADLQKIKALLDEEVKRD
ncbi:BlaI/MecI/CopY family transcriptional regulator [Marinicella sediminis]|uniref:BlaI/MecI/CopY family transcriptional regulator n=1 Tax=Marinicella sediminis TaxID=1792834 RepID=A0ABV7JDG2_9GAMM|nr:BlaI/MecI/CopY family transcriptional regulator [Marinicella sediminis]